MFDVDALGGRPVPHERARAMRDLVREDARVVQDRVKLSADSFRILNDLSNRLGGLFVAQESKRGVRIVEFFVQRGGKVGDIANRVVNICKRRSEFNGAFIAGIIYPFSASEVVKTETLSFLSARSKVV